MRLANLNGRATIVLDDGIVDVATASQGAFSTSIDKCLGQLDKLDAWCRTAKPVPEEIDVAEFARDPRLGPVVNPQQVFAIGLNYRRHATESGLGVPTEPMVFTKFNSSVCGPNESLPIPGATTDYEAELVVVIGATVRDVSVDDALNVVAGYCVGQDFSERDVQFRSTPAQFLAREVVPQLRANRSVADDRGRRPRSPGPHYWHAAQRFVDAGLPHERHGLLGRRTDRVPVVGVRAAPWRPHLHRHARGRRTESNTTRVLAAGRRHRDDD